MLHPFAPDMPLIRATGMMVAPMSLCHSLALAAYPESRVAVEDSSIVLYPSRPPIARLGSTRPAIGGHSVECHVNNAMGAGTVVTSYTRPCAAVASQSPSSLMLLL